MSYVYVIGNGGFGREVSFLIKRGWDVFCGFINHEDDIPNFVTDRRHYVVAIGDPKVRERIYLKLSKIGHKVANYINDPSVVIMDEDNFIGEGSIICAGSILTTNIKIGKGVIVNLACTIGHDVVIEDFTTISPGANISGNVKIGKGCYIGTGSTIIEGISIGSGSVVAAGAVVTKDVPSGVMVAGVPAVVKKVF